MRLPPPPLHHFVTRHPHRPGRERSLAIILIEAVHDLPGVGENLQDHYQARHVYECTQRWTVNDEVRSPLRKLAAGLEWLFLRTGPLTVSAGHVGLFARTLFRRFFVVVPEFHLTEDTLALHLFLQRLKGLIDIIIANENLHACPYPFF